MGEYRIPDRDRDAGTTKPRRRFSCNQGSTLHAIEWRDCPSLYTVAQSPSIAEIWPASGRERPSPCAPSSLTSAESEVRTRSSKFVKERHHRRIFGDLFMTWTHRRLRSMLCGERCRCVLLQRDLMCSLDAHWWVCVIAHSLAALQRTFLKPIRTDRKQKRQWMRDGADVTRLLQQRYRVLPCALD